MAKLSKREIEALISDSIETTINNKKKYTQRDLAKMYGISVGMVNRYIKEPLKKSEEIIAREVKLRTELLDVQEEKSKHGKQIEIEVNKEVNKAMQDVELIRNSAKLVLKTSLNILKSDEEATVQDALVCMQVVTEAGNNLGVIKGVSNKVPLDSEINEEKEIIFRRIK